MKTPSASANNPASSLARKWKQDRIREVSSVGTSYPADEVHFEVEAPQSTPKYWVRSTPALVLLGLLPIVLNSFLAIVNAHMFRLGFIHAALAEVLVLIAVGTVALTSPKTSKDLGPILLFAFFCASTVMISMNANAIQLDSIRNIAIVTFFALIGLRFSQNDLRTLVNIGIILVVLILLIEIFSVQTYVSIFEPAQYFASTRGLNDAEYNETGLFGNALGWEGRFSILNIMDHRGSSLFLEQVSLGNFAMIITIYIYTFWNDLRKWERIGILAAVVLMVIATASRSASSFFVIAPILALAAPKLHRIVPLAVMPLSLLAALVLYSLLPPTTEDNLAGRIGYTMRNLSNLDLPGYLGANAATAGNYADSGYVYFIAASSIFGLIAFWLFTFLFSAAESNRAKVCTLLAAVYIFMNLLVSGTSIFSLKTASLLWLIVGQVVASIPAREQNGVAVSGRRPAIHGEG